MKKIRDEFSVRNVRDSRRRDKAETMRRKHVRRVKSGAVELPVAV